MQRRTYLRAPRGRRVEPYEPGAFYKRELPCILAVLTRVDHLCRDATV